MPFLDEVERLFGTRDLYKALETERGADEKTIRRAYYRLSMRFHPDRATEDEATEKFQTLSRMNEILSDSERRSVYDETGEVDDDSVPSDRDWTEYWRVLYKKISEEDVRAFHEGYKGSKEEMEDLKAAYMASEGDMDKIMETVLCASVLDDEERFREMLDGWIEEGHVPKYKAYMKETKAKRERRRKRAVKEAKEAKALSAELGLSQKASKNLDDLTRAIQKRGKDREKEMESFFDQLEKKYAGGGGKGRQGRGKKKQVVEEEPDEVVNPKVTLRKERRKPEPVEPSKKQPGRQKRQGASSRAKAPVRKRAKKLEDVEDDEMDSKEAEEEEKERPPVAVVAMGKANDQSSSSGEINQDEDTVEEEAGKKQQTRRPRKAAVKKRGGKAANVQMDSKQKAEETETRIRKKEVKKKKVVERDESEEGKSVSDGETKKRGRKRRADKDEVEDISQMTTKASLRVSKVRVGKKLKLSDEDDEPKTVSKTQSPVKGGRKKAKTGRKVAAAGKGKRKQTKP